MQYKSPVEKILVDGDRAVGVRLSDGTEHHVMQVICKKDKRPFVTSISSDSRTGDQIGQHSFNQE